jgi:hypothetical protein
VKRVARRGRTPSRSSRSSARPSSSRHRRVAWADFEADRRDVAAHVYRRERNRPRYPQQARVIGVGQDVGGQASAIRWSLPSKVWASPVR